MSELTEYMKGYIDAATDYGQGWMGLELSNATIESHVNASNDYSKEYIEGYMVSVNNLRATSDFISSSQNRRSAYRD